MPPRSTIWPLDEHTRGKHLVLKHYLNAWLPILGQSHGRIVFIDAFAGPGRYSMGEAGSPIIAIQAFRDHAARARVTANVQMLFIEADRAREEELRRQVAAEREGLPDNFEIEVVLGRFAETLTELLNSLDHSNDRLAPCFMMVDPFGVSGIPMVVIDRFLRHQHAEVLVTFMVDFIDRFDETGEFPPKLDELYGTSAWRDVDTSAPKAQRIRAYCSLYRDQLRSAGATSVLRFDLFSGARMVYSLFHGSKHRKACEQMKQAIWKADPSGEFSFRGTRSGQLGLGFGPTLEGLQRTIKTFLVARDWVTREEIWDFVNSDQTDYHGSQIRKGALIPLEEAREIEVHVEGRRAPGTYPEGRTRIRIRR